MQESLVLLLLDVRLLRGVLEGHPVPDGGAVAARRMSGAA